MTSESRIDVRLISGLVEKKYSVSNASLLFKCTVKIIKTILNDQFSYKYLFNVEQKRYRGIRKIVQ